MNQTDTKQPITLDDFGTPFERVEKAVAAIKAGNGVLVMDDENRENEGDFIFAADTITTVQMALLITEGSGIVCLTLPEEKLNALELPQMVTENSSSMGTAFTVSIEAQEGVTTGVSAADRVTTIKTAIKDDCKPSDVARPGHVFPLRAKAGGILARAGHTEASVELVKMAGHIPAGVLCELTLPDGTMARLPEICEYGIKHNMPVVTIEDLIAFKTTAKSAAA